MMKAIPLVPLDCPGNDGRDRIAAFFDLDRRAGLSRNKPGNAPPRHPRRPVVPAEGGDDWAAGIQRNEGHNLVVITGADDDEGDTARSSGLPGQ